MLKYATYMNMQRTLYIHHPYTQNLRQTQQLNYKSLFSFSSMDSPELVLRSFSGLELTRRVTTTAPERAIELARWRLMAMMT